MSLVELVPLLRRIRDDVATADERVRARALVGQDDRLPQDVRRDALVDDPRADAVGLLAVLGEEDLFGADLAAAIASEAGRVDLPLDDAWAPMQDALRSELAAEAGTIDITGDLGIFGDDLADLGGALRDVAREEAGEVDLWAGIAQAIGAEDPEAIPGWDGALLAEAVRAEAGTVDVTDAVMAHVRRSALVPAGGVSTRRAANRRFYRWVPAAIGMAAAAVLMVLAGHDLSRPGSSAFDVRFAAADEISINDLSYADNTDVQVIRGEGDDAPLIIWVDDNQEAKL